jgi:phenylacetate-CoA ligase
MSKYVYWDKEIQTASKEALIKLQVRLLRKQIQRVYDHSRFYRTRLKKANIRPTDIKSVEVLARVPLTTKKDLEGKFRDVLAVPFSTVATIRQSSGTTGLPLTIAHTKSDIERIGNASARKLYFHGITKKDVVQVTAQYGLFQGAWSLHWGIQKIGACEIPVGPGDTERQIQIIKDFGTTVLYAVTNYHLRIAEVAKNMGENLNKSSLKTAICVSEKPTKQQRTRLASELGYKNIVLDYGATEFPGFSVYCDAEEEAHHVWADYYLIEALDSKTHEPVGLGEKGELVITSLQSEAFPLIRYSSRDITDYWGFEECSCGMCHPKIGTDIDRKDFMVKVRGVSVFPSLLEFVLSRFHELTGRCQIVVDKSTPKQEVVLKAESNQTLNNITQQILRKSIQQEVKIKLGITLDDVIFIPLGTFEDKMKKSVVMT